MGGGMWVSSLYPDADGAAPPPPRPNPNVYSGPVDDHGRPRFSDTDDDDDADGDQKGVDLTSFHGTRNKVAEAARARREVKRERGIARDEQRRAAEQLRREEQRRQDQALSPVRGHYDHHVIAPPQMPKLEAASDTEHYSRSPLGMARAAAADHHAAASHVT